MVRSRVTITIYGVKFRTSMVRSCVTIMIYGAKIYDNYGKELRCLDNDLLCQNLVQVCFEVKVSL